MSHIIHNIYLGNKDDAHNDTFIINNNIKYIINITLDVSNKYNFINYHNCYIEDSGDENIINYFDDIINIINENKYNNILIHCRVGKSRSASFILAYLMKYENMNLYESLNFLKNKRSIIQPNIYFFENLITFEYNLYRKNSITIWKYMNKTENEYYNFIKEFKK
jgi:atypical dual specificity phosphatase